MINAYPLAWPQGWPRCKSTKPGRFTKGERLYHATGGSYTTHKQLSVSDGVDRVLSELQTLGIDRQDIVISTNVPVRLDGLPRSGAPEPSDAGAAVYWQTAKGDTRVMAIDKYERVADNLAAIAATLDAMRAIERHGGAQILDRAFTGFTALPVPGTSKHWRDVLGVDGKDWGEIELAYKRLRSQHHPDRGGDPAKFAEVQQAYQDAREAVGA